MMYAELMRNHKKQRIKSLCDNKIAYVEYGHRQTPGRFVPVLGKKLKKSWVRGQFMMTKSAMELQQEAPAVLQRELAKYIREVFNGK